MGSSKDSLNGGRPCGSLSSIPTRWSVLSAEPRRALDYVYQVYGTALLSYIRGRLARGDFTPLALGEAEDLLQDFFVRIGTTDWLRKPDQGRGHFRPYLVRRVSWFLAERRSALLERNRNRPRAVRIDEAGDIPVPDPLEAHLEREWRVLTARRAMERIRVRHPDWYSALTVDLEGEGAKDLDLARRLDWSLDRFRTCLKRGRQALRDAVAAEEARLDRFGEGPS